MELVFKKAEIHNFLAIGNAEVDFDAQGFVVVSGVNKCVDDGAKSNGSGKSSIFDALLWCLTGETIRGTKDVSNIYTDDGALVKVNLLIDGADYTILRAKDNSEYKSALKLYKGTEDISGKGIRETAEIIQNKLPSIGADILRSVVIFGQGLPDRISNNTPSGRKQVLEKLSQSDFMIEDLKERVANRLKAVKNALRISEDRLLEVNTRIKSDEDSVAEISAQIAELEAATSMKIQLESMRKDLNSKQMLFAQHSADLAKKQETVSAMREAYKAIHAQEASELATMREGFSESIHACEVEIAKHREILRASETNITKANSIVDVCPTCGRKLDGVFRPDTTEDVIRRDNAKRLIGEYESKIAEQKAQIEKSAKLISERYADKTAEMTANGKRLNEEIEELKRKSVSLSDEIMRDGAEVERRDKLLSDTESKLSLLNERLSAVMADKVLYEQKKSYIEVEKEENTNRVSIVTSFNTVVSRDFRGYLLVGVIEYMRKSAQRYASKLFGTSNVLFEQDGNNLNIGYNGKLYENLSGGERQKVDIVMQLAVRDMLCNYLGFSCNILVMDEVTDNLDDEGCRGVMQLITDDLSDIQSVFIISHRVGSLNIPYDKEITVIKAENGVSSILG